MGLHLAAVCFFSEYWEQGESFPTTLVHLLLLGGAGGMSTNNLASWFSPAAHWPDVR